MGELARERDALLRESGELVRFLEQMLTLYPQLPAALQRRLAKGAKVAICGRTKNRVEETAEAIGAIPIVADVSVEVGS